MVLLDSGLRDRTVIGSDGRAVGEVVGLSLDTDSWRVLSLTVKLRKDVAARLGISTNVFRPALIQVPAGHIQSVGDAVILSISAEALQALSREAGSEETPAAH